MKHLLLAIFIIMLYSCNESKAYDIKDYILNPRDSDLECLESIKKAKKDIENGKIVFTYPCSLLDCGLRQEKYIKELCTEHHLLFEYEVFSDIILEGQTQGCYGVYMDRFIEKKYGKNFKENLLRQADSVLLAKSDTIVN